MEAAASTETFVHFYQTIQRHFLNPPDQNHSARRTDSKHHTQEAGVCAQQFCNIQEEFHGLPHWRVAGACQVKSSAWRSWHGPLQCDNSNYRITPGFVSAQVGQQRGLWHGCIMGY